MVQYFCLLGVFSVFIVFFSRASIASGRLTWTPCGHAGAGFKSPDLWRLSCGTSPETRVFIVPPEATNTGPRFKLGVRGRRPGVWLRRTGRGECAYRREPFPIAHIYNTPPPEEGRDEGCLPSPPPPPRPAVVALRRYAWPRPGNQQCAPK